MKKLSIIIFLALAYLSTNAQPLPFPPQNMDDEAIIRMQMRDILMWLNLDEKTEKKFVKEYSAFKKEIDGVAKNTLPPMSNANEEEIEKAIKMNFEISERILDIRKKYYQRFREFMKPSQILGMYNIENAVGRSASERPVPMPPQPMPRGPEPRMF